MALVTSAGTPIYYEAHGAGEAIVFAHGAGGNAGIWFNQIAHFQDRFRCIAFDHRTFARSPCSDLSTVTPQQFREDLLAILDALEVDRAHLVGQSMGGYTVMQTAVGAPDRVASVTMSATPGGLPNPQPTAAVAALLGSSTQDSSGGAAAQGILQTMAAASLQQPALMQLYGAINAFNTQFSWANLRALGDPAQGITFAQTARVTCPVQFIAGAEDPLFPPALLESYVPHFPQARFVCVQDSGHSPYFEQPAVFNRLLEEFIASC